MRIQIRTLEQHAYAEISHDLFYKKEKRDNAEISRYLARQPLLMKKVTSYSK